MSLNVELLRSSFQAISYKADELVSTFYDTLFSRYPDIRQLFNNVRMPEQKQKLLSSLASIVRTIEDPDYLKPYLMGLGCMHVAYGTETQHYEAVSECLLHALKTTAGELWNDELEETWAAAFKAISEIMIEGAEVYGSTGE